MILQIAWLVFVKILVSSQVAVTDKHVPISVSVPCCNNDAVPVACPAPEKHVPISVSRPCIPEDGPPTNACLPSTSIISTETGTGGGPIEQCKLTVSDPMTVTVTVTGTTTTTFISTVRRIDRVTSFSTTTATTTIRLTSTVLSISARTVTEEQIFTMPTFVLITRYSYVDSTETRSTTVQSFVGTFTNLNTITRVSVIRFFVSTTTTTTTTKTLPGTTTSLTTNPTITFTDVYVIFQTNAPTTSFTTSFLYLFITTTLTDYPNAPGTVTTTYSLVSVELLPTSVTSYASTQGIVTTSVFASNPATLLNPTFIETVLIPAP